MTPSDPTPKLPTWIFLFADFAFVAAAGGIAWNSWNAKHPFSDGATFAIVLCLVLGAICGLIPIVVNYERQKNEALDDRQRALEALARTVTASAEQISIAASSLNGIAELSLRNLRNAEQLPQKLQEKVSEFAAQLTAVNDAEKEELERELAALRTTESERLESISDKLSKSTAEWAKLEAATQKNLAASQSAAERVATDTLSQLTASTTAAVAQAAAAAAATIASAAEAATRDLSRTSEAATQAIAVSTGDAERSLAAAQTRTTAEIEDKSGTANLALSTTAAAVAALETKLLAATDRLERALEAAAKAPPPAPVHLTPPPPPVVADTPPPASAEPASVTPAPVELPAPVSVPVETTAHPPKRPRKPRREPAAPEEAPAPAATAPVADTPPPAPADEPPPVPAAAIAEVAPVAPQTSDPFPALPPQPPAPAPAPEPEPTPAAESAPTPKPAPTPAPTEPEPVATEPVVEPEPPAAVPEPEVLADSHEAETDLPPEFLPEPSAPEPEAATRTPPPAEPAPLPTAPAPAPEPEPAPEPAAKPDESAQPARKRAAKKAEPAEDDEPGLGLEIDDTPAPQSAELAERVLTSDGATRLIATAYIGIGNRLFIRGEGPGLSWEKGVPLQFVSIGKWRWETSDATEPVSFKLYKNDTVECTALGAQTLDPGHQQELTASF